MTQAPALPTHRSLSPEIMRYDSENNDISNEPKDAPLRSGHLALEVCSLQEEMMKASPSLTYASDAKVLKSILERCLDIDERFQDWQRTLPSQWETSLPWFERDLPNAHSQSSPNTSAYRLSHMLAYPTLHIAEMYNQNRIHRIKLQVIIMQCAFKIATSHECQREEYIQASTTYKTAHRVCLEAVNDICATVPFHFGERPRQIGPTPNIIPTQIPNLGSRSNREIPIRTGIPARPNLVVPQPPLQSTEATGRSIGVSPPQPALRRNMGFYMLLQPLLFAQSVVGVSDGQRAWVMDQAMAICQRTGMDEEVLRMRFGHMRKQWEKDFWPLDGQIAENDM